MYKEVAKLILYRDLGEDSILLKLSGIFRDFELGLAEKEELPSRIYEQMKALLDLSTQYGFDKNLWHNYLTFILLTNENSFSMTSEKVGANDGTVNHFAKADFAVFKKLFDFDFGPIEKDLGIDCYDREILRMASDDSGLNLQMFGNPDERRRNTFLTRAIKKVYKGEVIPPDSDDFASSDNLFNYQAKILKELAEQESYVVIGRCADFILRDNPNVVSVFIHAPFDYCVERGLEKQSMTRAQMEKYIQKTDKQKGDYYMYHTGQHWSDARNYDLCLDSSKLGFAGCVEAIKAYMAVRFKED